MLRRLDVGAISLAANAEKMPLAELADVVLRDGVSIDHKKTAENAIIARIADVCVQIEEGSADRMPMLRLLANLERVSSRQLKILIKGLFADSSFEEWPPVVRPPSIPTQINLSRYLPTNSSEFRFRTTSARRVS